MGRDYGFPRHMVKRSGHSDYLKGSSLVSFSWGSNPVVYSFMSDVLSKPMGFCKCCIRSQLIYGVIHCSYSPQQRNLSRFKVDQVPDTSFPSLNWQFGFPIETYVSGKRPQVQPSWVRLAYAPSPPACSRHERGSVAATWWSPGGGATFIAGLPRPPPTLTLSLASLAEGPSGSKATGAQRTLLISCWGASSKTTPVGTPQAQRRHAAG